MTAKLLKYLTDRAQTYNSLFRNAAPVDVLTRLSELPYHSVNKALSQLKGAEGKKNLVQGLMAGGGASGATLGADYLSDGEVDNKGLAAVLGTLATVSPALFRGGRAGFLTGKQFLADVKNLNSKGVSIMSQGEKNLKESIISDLLHNKDSLLNNPLGNLGNLGKKDYRDKLLSIFKPSKTVNIDYLTNEAGSLESIAPSLKNMAEQFGKTELSAGTIVNPNIARRIAPKKGEVGVLQKYLAGLGYKRVYGETRPTKNIGYELNDVLRKRFESVLNKGAPAEGATATAPNLKNKSFFPFKFDTSKGDKIKMTAGRRAMSGEYAGEFLPELGWRDLTPAQKAWFKSQNISGPRDYMEAVDQAKSFYSHARNVAKNNPTVFNTDFKLPSLRTIFSSDKPFNFDYDLASLAPSLADKAI
jgi:hypothetical protein